MLRCIYCRVHSNTAFPSEHVLPQMFGRFTQNLTLDCVCGPCNNFFSKLELSFGRDSPEAMERLRHGLKPVSEASQVGRNRMRDMLVDLPGLHDGARVQMSSTNGELSIKPVPQIGFRRGEERPVWFDEDELSAEAVAPYLEGYLRIVRGPTDEDASRLMARLDELGVKVRDPMPLDPPADDGGEIDTVITYVLDATIRRVVAKIAFNYAAWVAGAEFMLHRDFDAIRAFIRHESSIPWDPVLPVDRPILADETREWRRKELHLLTVQWNPRTAALLGQISFFNIFNYWVPLCDGFTGVWIPIHSGHVFSLITRDVRRLASSPT